MFETDRMSLQADDVCLGDGYEGVEKPGGYKCMTMIFNDRAFNDGWTEPYLVHLKLKTMQSARDIASQLAAIAQEHYEDGNCETSAGGIHQIMDRFKDMHPELEYFIFGCPTVPFGDDIRPFDILQNVDE